MGDAALSRVEGREKWEEYIVKKEETILKEANRKV